MKGTWLYDNDACISDLRLFCTGPSPTHGDSAPQLAVNYTNSQGRRCCKGGPDLKQSQTYPDGFGLAIVRLHNMHRKRLQQKAATLRDAATRVRLADLDLTTTLIKKSSWSDAELNGVFKALKGML